MVKTQFIPRLYPHLNTQFISRLYPHVKIGHYLLINKRLPMNDLYFLFSFYFLDILNNLFTAKIKSCENFIWLIFSPLFHLIPPLFVSVHASVLDFLASPYFHSFFLRPGDFFRPSSHTFIFFPGQGILFTFPTHTFFFFLRPGDFFLFPPTLSFFLRPGNFFNFSLPRFHSSQARGFFFFSLPHFL